MRYGDHYATMRKRSDPLDRNLIELNCVYVSVATRGSRPQFDELSRGAAVIIELNVAPGREKLKASFVFVRRVCRSKVPIARLDIDPNDSCVWVTNDAFP